MRFLLVALCVIAMAGCKASGTTRVSSYSAVETESCQCDCMIERDLEVKKLKK